MTASINSMMATRSLGEPPSSSNSGQADEDMYLTHKVSLIAAWSQRRVQTVTLQDVSTFWPVSPLPLHARCNRASAAGAPSSRKRSAAWGDQNQLVESRLTCG